MLIGLRVTCLFLQDHRRDFQGISHANWGASRRPWAAREGKSFNFSVVAEASVGDVRRDLGGARNLGRRQTHARIGWRRRRNRWREPSEQRRPVASERPRLACHRVDGLARGAVEDSQRHRRRAAAGLGRERRLRRATFGAVSGRERGGVHGHARGDWRVVARWVVSGSALVLALLVVSDYFFESEAARRAGKAAPGGKAEP